ADAALHRNRAAGRAAPFCLPTGDDSVAPIVLGSGPVCRMFNEVSMSRTIDYYFSLVSPWAYLGHAPFIDVARRHGVKVNVKPMSLASVFPETGGLPLGKRAPARQRYRLMEMQRWREKRGVPLNIHPKFWPFNVGAADHI